MKMFFATALLFLCFSDAALAWDPGIDVFDTEFKAMRCVLTAQVVSDVVRDETRKQTEAVAKLRTTGCLIGDKCKSGVVIKVEHVARFSDPGTPAYAMSFPVGQHVILATRQECDAIITFGDNVTHPHDHLWSCLNDFGTKEAQYDELHCRDLTSDMSLESANIDELWKRLHKLSDIKK